MPSSLCTFITVVLISIPVSLSNASSLIIALVICASPITDTTEFAKSVVIVVPVAEPNNKVFTFSTSTFRSLTLAFIASKSVAFKSANSPLSDLRLSIVAYVISASALLRVVVSNVPIFASVAIMLCSTSSTFVFVFTNSALFAITVSILRTLDASILSIQSPSTVPLSFVILSTVSVVLLYFCTYEENESFRLDISQVSSAGLSG